ncbi:DUF305 domain-containing protein [Agrococcus terreus]|uniref:DUF305 domain-containing protein n=1 Tax=Agrococcus terreus TaxID=574649 RepID=UPI00384CAAD7
MYAPKRALAASALTIALALTGCSAASEPATSPSISSSSTPTTESAPSPVESSAGAAEATGYNQDDVMFAMNMIAHHQQAIEMSDTLLAKSGVDDRVTELAERIRAAQQPEIEQMTAMLEGWGVEMSDDASGTHHDMGGGDGGMMSESDMALLEEAPGSEASRLFVEQMIMHHDGAVEMAEAEVDAGQNAYAVELAERIISDQSSEIAEMEALLDEL